MAASAEKAKKVCYYELLGLDRKCEAAEIKTNYRKLALQMHPDKAHQHGLSVEEATRRFQQVQEAYSVLSDAQERAWYDAHREQILRGDDEAGEDPFKTRINLYKYFSSGCFEGFGDGPQGFFTVYAGLFEAINTEEAEWEDADEERMALPPFGGSTSEWADTGAFYRHWLEFCSRKAFGHADKWNPKEAQNRQVRRAMEQENKNARQTAKKEFNAEVRQLVRFVQKRDPRVAAHQRQQMKDAQEKSQRELADKQSRKAAEARERQDRKDAARQADEERWAEAAAARAAARARGEVVSEDESSEKDTEACEYRCEACRKTFKSEKAYDQHAKSKKHLQTVAKLRSQLEQELEAGSEEAEAEGEDTSDAEEAVGTAAVEGSEDRADRQEAAGGEKTRHPGGEDEVESEDDDEDEDEEDAFIARFAAARKPAAASAPPKGGRGARHEEARGKADEAEGGEDEDGGTAEEDASSNASAGVTEMGGGKKAQKRSKQRAILLEKKAEKASVQELVDGCRKAAKGNKTEEETADGASSSKQTPNGQAADMHRCEVCGENFTSRTKLFQHIKATGHAALKPGPAAEGATAKGRRKKR
mmetsp:Transcript_116594/g.341241  ORF Transcript_116594/g.341241 Transcript_116594/m.341241 type:complete len:590 (+) Transcript_116594:103-1872(+)